MSKNVTYSIQLLSDDGNAARMQSLRSQVGAFQKDIMASGRSFGVEFGRSVTSALSNATRGYHEEASKRAQAVLDRLVDESRASARKMEDSMRSFKDIEASINRKSEEYRVTQTFSQQQQFGGRYPAHAYDSQMRNLSASSTGRDPRDDDSKKSATAEGPDYSTADFVSDLRGNASSIKSTEKDIDKASDAAGRLQDRIAGLNQLSDEASAKLSKNTRDLSQGFEGVSSGVGQLAQGIAILGAGSEDAKKLVDNLLLVKGGADTFIGFGKTVSGVIQTVSLLRERQQLAAKSADLLSQRQDLASASTRELSTSMRREASAAASADAATDRHAKSLRELEQAAERATASVQGLDNAEDKLGRNQPRLDSGGRTRGGRRGLLGAGASLLGYAGLNFLSGQVGDSSGLIEGLGDLGMDHLSENKSIRKFLADNASKLKTPAGGALLSRLGASGVGGTALTTLGAGVAAVGGVAFGGTSAYSSFSGMGKYGIGGGADADSFADKVGKAEASVAAWIVQMTGTASMFEALGNPVGGLAKSMDSLEKATKGYNDRIKKEAKEEPQRQLTNDLAMLDRNAEQTKRDARFETNARARAGAVQSGQMSALDAATGNSRDVQQSLNKELATIRDYERRLTNLRSLAGSAAMQESRALSAMQGVYQDAVGQAELLRRKMMETQQGVIEGIRAEAASRRQINSESISAAQSRLSLVEKERDLFKTSEQRLQDAAVKFSHLSDGDKFATIQAQETAKSGGNLSRRQRELLENLNLGAENELVRGMDLRDAQKSGFFNRFGSFEKSQMQGSMGRANQLMDIQRQAQQIGVDGDPRRREAQLRALNQRQEQIGLAQQDAASRNGFQQSAADLSFKQQAQQVRAEVQVRQDFNVRLGLDEAALIAGITRNINAQMAAIEKRINDGVNNKLAADRKERTAQASAQAIAARNAKG